MARSPGTDTSSDRSTTRFNSLKRWCFIKHCTAIEAKRYSVLHTAGQWKLSLVSEAKSLLPWPWCPNAEDAKSDGLGHWTNFFDPSCVSWLSIGTLQGVHLLNKADRIQIFETGFSKTVRVKEMNPTSISSAMAKIQFQHCRLLSVATVPSRINDTVKSMKRKRTLARRSNYWYFRRKISML